MINLNEDLSQIKDVGDVVAEKIFLSARGKLIDIQEFVLQTTIFEDIFSNVMTASIVIRDSANIINENYFSGLEQVILKFKTPGFSDRGSIDKTFYINSVDGRTLGEKDQIYILQLISVEAANDNVIRISKKFKGKTDNVIKQIFNDYLRTDKNLVSLVNHNTNTALVSPFWSPFKVINWICNRSYERAPNILLFESNKNFYLTSLEHLYKQTEYATYKYIPTSNTTEWSLADRFYLVTGLTEIPYFDVFKGHDNGYYTSKLITHDITLKQYKEFQHDHYGYKQGVTSLDRFNPFPNSIIKNSDSYRTVRTKQFNMFSENPDPQYEVWAMQRNSLMYEANNLKFVIRVPGKTDIEVGRTINLEIPRSVAKDLTVGNNISNLFDPYLTGRYLITGIRHQFTLNKHEMFLEVMKESFQTSID